MDDFLILKLDGPMQAWGRESYEGLRPSELFPGRSSLLGLLGACLGIDRDDQYGQSKLAYSVNFAVRVDAVLCPFTRKPLRRQKLTDYHTVLDARKEYRGLTPQKDSIQTWREYWQDSRYTVVVWLKENAEYSLDTIRNAIQKPVYAPVLGRKSCPIARPLYEASIQADSCESAFLMVEPLGGTIYSDVPLNKHKELRVRDVPIVHQPRQFASRTVYMQSQGEGDVS
jgi:CRISPR system Cascade subunit CasD